jgi:S-(hydroxymethyl)glutathione dehydrogenase / alcohol dehydrogenase
MKAAVLFSNDTDRLEVVDDITVVDPGFAEISVKLMAAGVCHSDLSILNRTMPQVLPVVLGHEGAGIVTAVGDGVQRVK